MAWCWTIFDRFQKYKQLPARGWLVSWELKQIIVCPCSNVGANSFALDMHTRALFL